MRITDKPIYFEGGCAAALGTFDGVHIGHQRVITAAIKSGFTPVAVMIMQSGRKRKIFSDLINLKLLEDMGVDTVVCLNLNDICSMSPDEYLEMLYDKMNVRRFVCGHNHRFGKGAKGDFDTIEAFCSDKNISCERCDIVYKNGLAVSSTVIREKISDGCMEEASKLLGHDYMIDFAVEGGDSRGKQLGFPTINQPYPDDFVLPKFGVYAAKALVDGVEYDAVLNVGVRPTFLTDRPLSETHIIGYSGDLYGKRVTVKFKKFIRPEQKFSSFDDIIDAIKSDKEKCIAILNNRE